MSSIKVTFEPIVFDRARTLAAALTESTSPTPDAVTMFDGGDGWCVEAYYPESPDVQALVGQFGKGLPFPAPGLEIVRVPDEDWVTVSQSALPPVMAGRFTIHGSHDRAHIARGPNTLEIDAGEAFGTAHHATTQGCLLALDRLARRRSFCNVLDLGCGSGVLALAAARALPRAHITASDHDPQAVAVARANARVNGVGRRVRIHVAEGVPRTAATGGRPYDLILANILAGPLVRLAGVMSRSTGRGSIIVLSGLLNSQAAEVAAAYRSRGFAVTAHLRLGGWSTLVLLNRGPVGLRRDGRSSSAA